MARNFNLKSNASSLYLLSAFELSNQHTYSISYLYLLKYTAKKDSFGLKFLILLFYTFILSTFKTDSNYHRVESVNPIHLPEVDSNCGN